MRKRRSKKYVRPFTCMSDLQYDCLCMYGHAVYANHISMLVQSILLKDYYA